MDEFNFGSHCNKYFKFESSSDASCTERICFQFNALFNLTRCPYGGGERVSECVRG